jgi:hypothetical protein
MIIIGIVVFHILMLLLAAGIMSRIVRSQQTSTALGYLHNAIGITKPSPEQVRMVALIWLGSVIVIVDGCLVLLVFVVKLTN